MKLVIGICGINLLIFLALFKRPNKRWQHSHYDCAIVCGYPATLQGKPSTIMKSRVDQAIALYQSGKVDYLIFSGGAVQNNFVEAMVMYQYAITKNVPVAKIILETKAVSTFHNLRYCHDIMASYHFKSALVVTNSWHLRKANHYADKFLNDYAMVKAKDEQMSVFATIILTLKTNIMMYFMMFKGYY